jgi:hypothetical protein
LESILTRARKARAPTPLGLFATIFADEAANATIGLFEQVARRMPD